ncbi:(2Fe-2S)-binding protein [Metabacillus sp. KIGAM252]|uniref:(2Fe-2S)-binding protein n=1 Tax=Metabacillus flavus TaxID=2823519 RepID=A0ABS5LI86_9BACI|nr:IucA/IucC family C-terminal-domain containing protein [Metabacillus flavus]MBS2970452.1 (2Fe-2S)-binding protein [Metabacillus flavus]
MAEFIETELAELEKFRLGRKRWSSSLSVEVKDLLDPESLKTYLDKVKPKIEAPDRKTAVSMLLKRYGFLAALTLYSMTVFNKAPILRPENLSLETDDQDPLWLPSFHFHNMEAIVPGNNESREEWRSSVIRQLFAENIHPLIKTASRNTSISKWILWENVSIYVRWMFETLMASVPEGISREKVESDFNFTVAQAEGSLFGDFHQNPLKRYDGQITIQPETGQEIRMRRTCCLFYLTSDRGARCKTCPVKCVKPPKGYGG